MFFKSLLILLVGLIVNTPLSVHAHQPRIAQSNQTVVSDPEISKAFYGKLTGEPHVYTITTTWNPVIIFFSGFAFFEALFGWCGFYAALGKNTCPIK